MNETSNIIPLRQPDEIDDPLTDILSTLRSAMAPQMVFAATGPYVLFRWKKWL